MDYSVVNMGIEDYAEVIALWRSTEGLGLSKADSEEGISRFLIHNPGLSYVARRKGGLVGAVLCGCDGRRGYIHHLAVEKGNRRLGIGKALVSNCLKTLNEQGIQKCHIFVFTDNQLAIDFWNAATWKQRFELILMSKDT